MPGNPEIAGLDWPADRLLPRFQTPRHLDIYDIRGVPADVQLSVTTLSGLVNRPEPRMYLISNNDDDFWRTEVFGSIAQSRPAVSGGDILGTLLSTYSGSVQGMIIYDPSFTDSINVATTMAGQRGGIVVSPAQAQALALGPHKLAIIDDLRNYKWRSRVQAYRWAQQNLLNGTSRRLVAGIDPGASAGLRSFLVAAQVFVYWLDSRNFLPDPTAGLQSERGLMQQILSAFPGGGVHLGWFIDEVTGVCMTSQAGLMVLASDFCNNLEVYTGVQAVIAPVEEPIEQKLAEQVADSALKTVAAPATYVSFTISDGDNLQYTQHRMLHLWGDSARGSIPLGWTISPALLQAEPGIAAYYARTASANDELIAGPSGIGYIYPSAWPAGQLAAFLQSTAQAMEAMNLRTLEVLDKNCKTLIGGTAFSDQRLQQAFVQALSPVGLRGLLSGDAGSKPGFSKAGGVPVCQNLGLVTSVAQALSLIRGAVSDGDDSAARFLSVYIQAWGMTPTDIQEVVRQLGSGYEVVTPGRLLSLIAEAG